MIEAVKMHAKVMGQGEPLVILHGVFGSGDNWGTLGRKWSEEYEVHLLDARNHGHSPHTDLFSYEAMAVDLEAYLEENGISQARILGHSMGGKVAMQFAVLHPEKVGKMVVADIAPKAYEPHHQKILQALTDLDLDNISNRKEAEEAFGISDFGTRQFLLKSLYWKEKNRLAWRFNLPVIMREIEKVGESLPPQAIFEGDTLFIRGGASWYIQDEDWDMILQHFPKAKLETVEGAGHWLHAERPQEFYRKVSAFLAD